MTTKKVDFFIGGRFRKPESGKISLLHLIQNKEVVYHVYHASAKDIKNSVEASKLAQLSWNQISSLKRGRLILELAEFFIEKNILICDILKNHFGFSEEQCQNEIQACKSNLVYYGGFSDKFLQVLSSSNYSGNNFFNTTLIEPIGVVTAFAKDSLSSIIELMAAALVSGNVVVTIVPISQGPLLSILGEMMMRSEIPMGVVSFISGNFEDLISAVSSHGEVDGLYFDAAKRLTDFGSNISPKLSKINDEDNLSLKKILSFTKMKTFWHTSSV